MTYSIFDNGNLVASLDRENEASEALQLQRLADAHMDAASGLLLVAFDDAGNAVADCAPGEQIALPASHHVLISPRERRPGFATGAIRVPWGRL